MTDAEKTLNESFPQRSVLVIPLGADNNRLPPDGREAQEARVLTGCKTAVPSLEGHRDSEIAACLLLSYCFAGSLEPDFRHDIQQPMAIS